MKNKVLGIVVVAVVVLLAAYAYMASEKPANQNQGGSQNQDQSSGPNLPVTAETPAFVLGEVTKTESGKIYFRMPGADEKVAMVTDSTTLVKQVPDKDGLKNATAQFSDFKVSSTIVVYYLEQPEGNVYKATKVQRIN